MQNACYFAEVMIFIDVGVTPFVLNNTQTNKHANNKLGTPAPHRTPQTAPLPLVLPLREREDGKNK